MKSSHNPFFAITSAVIAGILGGLLLTSCSKIEQSPAVTNAETIETGGSAPNMHIMCIKGLVFAATSGGRSLVQVRNEDDKPMRCDK